MQSSRRILIISGEGAYGREVNLGIHDYCRSHLDWELHWENDHRPFALERIKMGLNQWKASGVIGQLRHPAILQAVRKSRLPAVNFSSVRGNTKFASVTPDDVAVGRMAARCLLDNGMRNFAFCGKSDEAYAIDRCKGFCDELAQAGMACDVFVDKEFNPGEPYNWVRNRNRMERWLSSLPKPAAIFCPYDHGAQDAMLLCRQLGLRIPQDVVFMGSGNDKDLCEMTSPPLSSIDYGAQRIGFEAAHMMNRLLDGQEVPVKSVRIPPLRVVVRQSADLLAPHDPVIMKALRVIRDRLGQPLNVKDIIEACGISRRMLDRRFLKVLGRTPSAEIRRARLERAKELLVQTSLPVAAIAQRVGLDEARLLAKAFRRFVGMTPTKYRRRGQFDRMEATAPAVSPPLDVPSPGQ